MYNLPKGTDYQVLSVYADNIYVVTKGDISQIHSVCNKTLKLVIEWLNANSLK